jgi:hypothetical protein
VGRITSIGEERRYVRVRFLNREWPVHVEDATIREDGRRIAVRDLRRGDRVQVYGQIRGDEIRASRVVVTH